MTTRPPLTDSPFFWLYLFATTALIGVTVIGPKFSQRQAQIERQFQGRSRAEQVKAGQNPDVELSKPGETRWNLGPMLGVLSFIAIGGWVLHWYHRYRPIPKD